MALSLEKLIKLANLSPEVKKDALDNIDKMNEEQKFRLSQICWENIAEQYENKARLENDRMISEMANGTKNYSPKDFAALEEKMLTELLKVIQNTATHEEISDVKKELQKYIKTS